MSAPRDFKTPPSTDTGAPRAGTMTCFVTRGQLAAWPDALAASGCRVVAPVAVDGTGGTRLEYVPWRAGTGSGLDTKDGQAHASPKSTWFPRSEPILEMKREGHAWSVEEPPGDPGRTVILGARPCDAAAPDIVAPLFNWDYRDPFFNRRHHGITTVVLGCAAPVDEACFCTSVGVDPAGTGAGDVVLTPVAADRFLAEARTSAGEALLKIVPVAEGAPDDDTWKALEAWRAAARDAVPRRFDPRRVREALERRFDDPFWHTAADACLACGTCAFSCPTCHCFDVQDEKVGSGIVRQKNWDSCMFPLFTLHTSGHNPRPSQGARWRQRLSHKFRYFPEKFGSVLCTGCGRCVRHCPAGMDMLGDLDEIVRRDQVAVEAGEAVERQSVEPVEASGSGDPHASDDSTAPAPRRWSTVSAQDAAPAVLAGENIYRPHRVRIVAVREEAPMVRTLRLEFVDEAVRDSFAFRPGQFGLYSAFGEGESTFCIASSAARKGYIECTFRAGGRVTKGLRRLQEGDEMGFRGPYGNSFPVEEWKGRNLVFVGGGIGLPPVRAVIDYCLDHREEYGRLTVVHGARTSADLVYKQELAEWEARPDLDLWLCVDWKAKAGGGLDEAPAENGWKPLRLGDPAATPLDGTRRWTGFIPHLLDAIRPSAEDAVAVLCGPPAMIRFSLESLGRAGFEPRNVYTTLENRMKCGVGKCGRCNVGPVYVCKEGPVFTAEELRRLPPSEM